MTPARIDRVPLAEAGTQQRIELSIPAALLRSVDKWRWTRPERPTRAIAIRRLVEQALGLHDIQITE